MMPLPILLQLHEHRADRIGEKSSCERFCKVPNAENYYNSRHWEPYKIVHRNFFLQYGQLDVREV